MKTKKTMRWIRVIGILLLIAYLVTAVILMVSCFQLGIFPITYLLILGLVLANIGAIFGLMHWRWGSSIAASALSVVFLVGCIAGTAYVTKTNATLDAVVTNQNATTTVSLYVMEDDSAKSIADLKGYQIGILKEVDTENVQSALQSVETELGSSLKTTGYNSTTSMLTDLRSGRIGAILVNDTQISIVKDMDAYSWVETELRCIKSYTYTKQAATNTATTSGDTIPDNLPDTFIMYLSGIDTYGDVTEVSRSDVNILAVINRKTKHVYLLSTPRDYYVEYEQTDGEKDKLTHAGIYGIEASMDALERLYDIDINYYLKVNFSGFMEVIDALGGITVYSDCEFDVDDIRHYDIGYNTLTGIEALAFARERYSFEDGDYQRARNQMEVIRAVIDKCTSGSALSGYNTIMDSIARNFATNMPKDQLASLIRKELSDMKPWTVETGMVTGESALKETYSMPGQELYVIVPDEDSIEEAKEKINSVLNET